MLTSVHKDAAFVATRKRSQSVSHASPPIADSHVIRARALSYPSEAVHRTTLDAVEVSPDDLDMSEAAKVISAAQKFILPIPALSDGVPLVYPQGEKDKQGNSLEGKPITDWQGNPIGDKGVVFRNLKDRTVQAVQGDGAGVIIFNEATETQAAKLSALVKQRVGTPSLLNHADIEAVLDLAAGLGLTDCYDSNRSFIQSKMTPVGNLGADEFGLYKRDDRDICYAVRLDGRGSFKGPAATGQQYENGAVIVKQGDNFRLIQCAEFERTYRSFDGKRAYSSLLPLGVRR